MPPANPDFVDDSSSPVHVEGQCDEEMPPSIAIVKAIAVIEDVDPMECPTALGITLHDDIDPDALDQLVGAPAESTSVSVDLTLNNGHQYAIQIHDDGHLVVEKAA